MSDSKSESKPTYVGTKGVQTFFGGKSAMWVWRKLHNDPRFPKPVYFGKLPHWRVDWLEEYAANAPTTPSVGVAS